MSETWTSLLAALVGAIVGGAASLAGTVLVNKMQLATNARLRMYDELLPRLAHAIDREGIDDVVEVLMVLERVSTIAGREERTAVHKLRTRFAHVLDLRPLPGQEPTAEAATAIAELRVEVRTVSEWLGAKLG